MLKNLQGLKQLTYKYMQLPQVLPQGLWNL